MLGMASTRCDVVILSIAHECSVCEAMFIPRRIIRVEYDSQRRMKLTPLAVTVLGLLRERPMHPYEMAQILKKRGDDLLVRVSPGALYHTVEKLQDHGLVRIDRVEQTNNRPERTIYAVESAGERAAREWVVAELSTVRSEYPVFPVALAVAPKLPWSAVRAAFQQRIEVLRDQVSGREFRLDRARTEGIDEILLLEDTYVLELQAAQINHMQRTIDLVDSGALTWPPQSDRPDAPKEEA